MPKCVFFLGAGASAAFGLPTTGKFFQKFFEVDNVLSPAPVSEKVWGDAKQAKTMVLSLIWGLNQAGKPCDAETVYTYLEIAYP